MNYWQALAIAASILTIVSACLNVIQYNRRHSLIRRLRSFAQGTYMDHYMIARAVGRLKNDFSKIKDDEKTLNFWRELFYINGIADAARNNIIAVSKEHLALVPKFTHPAFPDQVEFDDDIKLGMMPDCKLLKSKQNAEQTRSQDHS